MSTKFSLAIIFAGLLLTSPCSKAQTSVKVDPYHRASGGFGYLVSSTAEADLWWAEGAYKIMQDMAVPSKKVPCVKMEAAKNEWESFQIVIMPKRTLMRARVQVSSLISKSGEIPSTDVTVRKVEYVKVKQPTDDYGVEGLWPDPLPKYKTPQDLAPGRNHPFWITVKIPKTATAGKYSGTVTITSEDGYRVDIPLSLEVWNFTLPDSPAMRSGFGFSLDMASRYSNLTEPEQRKRCFDLYMRAFSDYKISPYNPFAFTPITSTVTGVPWTGGFFDAINPHSGKYSYKIVDDSYSSTPEANYRERIPISGGESYTVSWWSRALEEDQTFVVGVECFDAEGNLMNFENRYEEFVCGKDWKRFEYPLGNLPEEATSVAVHLYPSKRIPSGEALGTTWFDDLELKGEGGGNLLSEGDFEFNPEDIDITLDFSQFRKGAEKYFGEYGFTAFHLPLEGLGGGTYYERQYGNFEGFEQGTDEYNRLMKRYLQQMQEGLRQSGMLGKEYIYWFDEPGDNDYDFVHETNGMIKEVAPELTTFLTEHLPGHDISDVTDITCTKWKNLTKEKTDNVLNAGKEYWSYLCTSPKAPWISLFIDHDAINMRMWSWGSYVERMSGILIWQTNYWNSDEASPKGILQNPWEEAMSWMTSYGLIEGKRRPWGNGDGRLFYPENRDVNSDKSTVYLDEVVPSYRLELLRDGIEDFEYLKMLERLVKDYPNRASSAKKLLQIPSNLYQDQSHYNKDPQAIIKYRKKVAEAIVKLR